MHAFTDDDEDGLPVVVGSHGRANVEPGTYALMRVDDDG
jgi:hypothetical protein